MTMLQRLLIVLGIVNAGLVGWYFLSRAELASATDAAHAATYAEGAPERAVVLAGPAGQRMYGAVDAVGAAAEWMFIGLGVSIAVLVAYWVAAGRRS